MSELTAKSLMPKRLRSMKQKPRIERMCFDCGERMYTTAQVVERWIYGYTVQEIVMSLSDLGFQRVFREDINAILRIKEGDKEDVKIGEKDRSLRTFKSWALKYHFISGADQASTPGSGSMPSFIPEDTGTEPTGAGGRRWKELDSHIELYRESSLTSTAVEQCGSQYSHSSDSISGSAIESVTTDTYEKEEDQRIEDESHDQTQPPRLSSLCQSPRACTEAAKVRANPIAEYVGMLSRSYAHPSTHTLDLNLNIKSETTNQPRSGNYDHCSTQCNRTYTTQQVVELWLLGFTVPEIWVQFQILGFGKACTDDIRSQLRLFGYDVSARSEEGDPFQRFVEGRGMKMAERGIGFRANSGNAGFEIES